MRCFTRQPVVQAEAVILAAAVCAAVLLGVINLGATSLWHDEAVQVHVAKNLLETGRPLLPSGHFHPVAPAYNALMAAFIGVFGDSERVVRLPAALLAGVNVLLTFLLVRPLLGRATALVAAVALALSPWNVAWSREARFYTMHQTSYLLTLITVWRMTEASSRRGRAGWAAGAAGAYLLGLGTSLHSVVFVAPVAAYAFLMAVYQRRFRSRWTAWCAGAVALGFATMVFYRLTLPKGDADAIFKAAGLGLQLGASNTPVLYYLDWLRQNLGTGFFILALAGTLLILFREGRRGVFAALAFWTPVLALSFLLAYRIHRFTFFAYPLYVALFSYAAVAAVRWFVAKMRTLPFFSLSLETGKGRFAKKRATSPFLVCATIVLVVFSARLGLSGAYLLGDTIRTVSGADITLATRHPQWRKPCLYVKERLELGDVVVSSTWVTANYYVGRVDNWYPSRHFVAETWEIGSTGLRDIEELAAYVAEHPRGYLIVELFRFFHFDPEHPDVAWVNEHMTLVEEACSGDVRVYRWGMDSGKD